MPVFKNEEYIDIEGHDKLRIVVERKATIRSDLSSIIDRKVVNVRLEMYTSGGVWVPVHMHSLNDLVAFHESLGNIVGALEVEDWMLD